MFFIYSWEKSTPPLLQLFEFYFKIQFLKLKQVQHLFSKRTVAFKNKISCYFYSRQSMEKKLEPRKNNRTCIIEYYYTFFYNKSIRFF